MGKKKGKKGKQKQQGTDVLNEVDKVFYELQITELNRKLARLRTYSTDLESKVTVLEQAQGKTEADRADVICYLKRTLQDKTTEALELQDRVVTLEKAQESNEEQHEEEIAELKAEFESMREQLVTEIKLITGKLNALEEFRMQRDDLMARFEIQANQIEEQEIRHKRNMYEVERKFILGKDAIKHEMEQQLFQLANDFESANELRIASTTQRVIRENIVINNELNNLLSTSEDFQRENSALKVKLKELNTFNSILEAERNKALKDYTIQKGVIHQMVNEVARQKDITASQECDIERGKLAEKELKAMKTNEEILKDKIKTCELQMHSIRCSIHLHKKNINRNRKHIQQLKDIIYETLYNVEELMELESSEDAEKRASLFASINKALRRVSHDVPLVESQGTIPSSSKLYQKGDLGFMPKLDIVSKPGPMHLHAESQVGPSFHDFLTKQKEVTVEETLEIKNVPETIEYEYKQTSDSDESYPTTISEESSISSKENDKEIVLSQTVIVTEEVEAEMEEEIEEEELLSVESSKL